MCVNRVNELGDLPRAPSAIIDGVSARLSRTTMQFAKHASGAVREARRHHPSARDESARALKPAGTAARKAAGEVSHRGTLEYARKLEEPDQLAGTLGMTQAPSVVEDHTPASNGTRRGKRKGNRGTGRRDLRSLPLEERGIVIPDPHLEALVGQGKVIRHGFEETCKFAHKRGGKRRVVVARVRYKTVDAAGNTDVITTAMPEQMLPGAIAAPSLVAHVIMENIGKGIPLFRIEDGSARDGGPFDRGSLSRWKTVGDRQAATVVHAMRQHALATAFCIATDATGICVQPIPNERTRQP